ncbi:MAG: Transcription elongation factor [Candidatus Magasanikbacteria bacterium GW2011_GWC2_34_16]|uniref:Transcription elongation factor GreA n=2 Tax=Candidatus Magasanikiibacteriota TaxID=1752731 RepID=A0A0G0H7W4_9BACT|nr:MAG: Transcription elongation factor [Candidatus Magasanikbacteria bacterium GW2011_GWC2_34_16]KKQ39358.1 MAG: Transcription elongation factor [Candidatus Magasanikbacteria bacterium GW2011_GWA2_37_8]
MRIPYRKPGKYTNLKPDPLVTEDKFRELEKKLKKLKKIKPQAMAEVSRLAELGDFSENVEYQLAKGKLRGINNSIMNLEHQINNAEIIKPQKQTNQVQLGNKVTINDGKNQKTYQILGSTETNPQKGVISYNSPIGSALIGHKINEVIKISLANKEAEYKILKIE